MQKEIAHFFWHGQIRKLEQVCITSFVKQGFDVKLWSYTGIQVPDAESCDARIILPEEHLGKYQHQHFSIKDGSKSTYASIAAFADVFRLHVIEKFGGWWFDTDCYCLRPAEDFVTLRADKPLLAGLQDSQGQSVANGVMYANKNTATKLIQTADQICQQHNYNFPHWGLLGPYMLSNFVQINDLAHCVVSIDKFYAIEGKDFDLFVDPEKKSLGQALIKNSYLSHVWNSMADLYNVSVDHAPTGSLLADMYDHAIDFSDTQPNQDQIDFYQHLGDQYKFASRAYKHVFYHAGQVDQIKYFVAENILESQLDQLRALVNLYRFVLRRDPDLGTLLSQVNLDFDQVKEILLTSDEYKQLLCETSAHHRPVLPYTIVYVNDRARENMINTRRMIKNFPPRIIEFFNAHTQNYYEFFSSRDIPITWDKNRWGRDPLVGEFGNVASFVLAYEHMVEHDLDEMIVFEDDAMIDSSFLDKFYQCYADLPDDFDYLADGGCFPDRSAFYNPIDVLVGSSVICNATVKDSHCGFMLYSRKGAEKILQTFKTRGFESPIDTTMYNWTRLGLLKGYTTFYKNTLLTGKDQFGTLTDPDGVRR